MCVAVEEKMQELLVSPDEQGKAMVECPVCLTRHLRSWLKTDREITCPHCKTKIYIIIEKCKSH